MFGLTSNDALKQRKNRWTNDITTQLQSVNSTEGKETKVISPIIVAKDVDFDKMSSCVDKLSEKYKSLNKRVDELVDNYSEYLKEIHDIKNEIGGLRDEIMKSCDSLQKQIKEIISPHDPKLQCQGNICIEKAPTIIIPKIKVPEINKQ